jgi:predicted Abi (CAAX) family protease
VSFLDASVRKIASSLTILPIPFFWFETLGWLILVGIITRRFLPQFSASLPRGSRLWQGNRFAAGLVAFFIPSLAEELFFRVLQSPDPQAPKTVLWVTHLVLALFAFAVWHPLQAWTFRNRMRPVFTNPVFLMLVFGLGAVCAALYLRSGSIWPAVLVHWFAVLFLFIFPQSSTDGM